MPAREALLSPVADLCRRLVLEAFLGIVPGIAAYEDVGGMFSSSSSSCSAYGFTKSGCASIHLKFAVGWSGLVALCGAFSLRWISKCVAHFFIISSFWNLMTKFSTPGSPFHQI